MDGSLECLQCRMGPPPTPNTRICCERRVGQDRHDFGAPTAGAERVRCGYWPSLVESGRVTRRAPPLEIISRYSTTRRPVHRPFGRWTDLPNGLMGTFLISLSQSTHPRLSL